MRNSRCARCFLLEIDCACRHVEAVDTSTHVALVLHRRELGNPNGSEALVLAALGNCRLFVHGQKDQPLDLGPLADPGRRLLLLYPSERARPLTPQLLAEDPREVTLIVVGGSWRRAGRAARRVPGVERAEQVCLALPLPAEGLRVGAQGEGLSTFEAVAQALEVLERPSRKRALALARAAHARTALARVEPSRSKVSGRKRSSSVSELSLFEPQVPVTPLAALDVLYRDEWLVVVDKPSGYLVHRGWGEEGPVILQALRDQLGRTLYPVHRLDRQTSGVLLLAFYPEVARDLQVALEQRRIQKSYLALCRGNDPSLTRIEHPLTKEPGKGVPKPALTELKFLGAAGRYGLYRVHPHTGRAHQIRRHLKHVSHPLIGDVRYGKGEHNRLFREKYDLHRLALHCDSVTLVHPRTGEPLSVKAKLPHDLAQALVRLGLEYGGAPFDEPGTPTEARTQL